MNNKPKIQFAYMGLKMDMELKFKIETAAKAKGLTASEWMRGTLRKALGIADKRYCVYSHSIGGKVFYVGSGSLTRPYSLTFRNSTWSEMVRAGGGKYEINIIATFVDRQEARDFESSTIKRLDPPANLQRPPNRAAFTKWLLEKK